MNERKIITITINLVVSLLTIISFIALVTFNASGILTTSSPDRVDSASMTVFDVPDKITVPNNESYHFTLNGTFEIETSYQIREIEVWLAGELTGCHIEYDQSQHFITESGKHTIDFEVHVVTDVFNTSNNPQPSIRILFRAAYIENPGLFYTTVPGGTYDIIVEYEDEENITTDNNRESESLLSNIPLPVIILFSILLIAAVVVIGYIVFRKTRR